MEHSSSFPDCFYRVSVKALVVREGKILLAYESATVAGATTGKWELLGGGLDFGESIADGLKREVFEETGLAVEDIAPKPTYVWTVRHENRRKLDWFYSLVLCYRAEFPSLEFTPSNECLKLEFFSKEELETLNLSNQLKPFRDYFNPKDFS